MVRRYTTTCLLITTILGLCGQASAIAQPIGAVEEITALPNDWSFWPTDNDQAPRRTVSGASRGSCSPEELTALVPSSAYGTTRQAYPEVLVSMSTAMSGQALFSLQSDDYYYETYINLPDTAGIIAISLPNEAPALAANELYQWSLILMCDDSQLRPDSPAIQGWIKTQPTIEAGPISLELEQAVAYRDDHIWYDMIALLAELNAQHPNDSAIYDAWRSILVSTNLSAVVDQPILK